MDTETMKAAVEAQFLMGHCVPSRHIGEEGTIITNWSWDEDQVRQALHVPLNALWEQRVLELEMNGLAVFSFDMAPVTWDAQGNEHESPDWRDQPREEWGSIGIFPAGVLRLAAWYKRPAIRWYESPTLIAHWKLVQHESEARLHAPLDEARWAREYPEKAIMWKAKQAALWQQAEASPEMQAWLADPQVQDWLEEIRCQGEQREEDQP